MTVYAIAGTKGGVGKTTLAVHLAAELLRRGRAVVLVDADPQQSASGWARRAVPALHVELAHDRDRLLELCRHDGDVVVDVVGALADTHLVALFAADVVVLPTGASSLDLQGMKATARLVENARAMRRSSSPQAFAVLNRTDPRTLVARDAVDFLQSELQLPVLGTVRASVGVVDAPGQGTLATGAAGDDLRAVVAKIIDHDHQEQADEAAS